MKRYTKREKRERLQKCQKNYSVNSQAGEKNTKKAKSQIKNGSNLKKVTTVIKLFFIGHTPTFDIEPIFFRA